MMPYSEDESEEDPGGELQTYDLEKEKLSTVTSGVKAYAVSMDHKVLVYQTKDGFVRLEAGATAAPKDDDAKDAKIDLSGWSLSINPREEWKQMLHEAWRLQRDFFYDPKMHGVDWEGVWKQYGSLADRIGSRGDLADCLGEMSASSTSATPTMAAAIFARAKESARGCSPPTCATTPPRASGKSRRFIAAITRCRTGRLRWRVPTCASRQANGWSPLTASRS
jgi:hypothetical protein